MESKQPVKPTVEGNPNVDDGGTVTFWCKSVPTAPPGSKYVWYLNGNVIDNARGRDYTTRRLSTGNTHDQYRCAVRLDGGMSERSNPVSLLGMYLRLLGMHASN